MIFFPKVQSKKIVSFMSCCILWKTVLVKETLKRLDIFKLFSDKYLKKNHFRITAI